MERIFNPAFLLILLGIVAVLVLSVRRAFKSSAKTSNPGTVEVVVSKVFRPGTTRVTSSSITQHPEEWLLVVSNNGSGNRAVSVSKELWNSVETGDKVSL